MSYVSPPPPYGYTPEPAPRRRRKWPYVVFGLLALALLCGVGSFVAFGSAVNEVDKQLEQAEDSRAADVKINGCKIEPMLDVVEITYTITSTSASRETYMPQFEVVGPNGDIVGNAGDITGELPAGGVYKGKAVGSLNEDVGKVTCRLVSA